MRRTSRSSRTFLALVLTVLFALVVAACGGTSGGGDSGDGGDDGGEDAAADLPECPVDALDSATGPVPLLLFVRQRQLIRGLTAGAVKG